MRTPCFRGVSSILSQIFLRFTSEVISSLINKSYDALVFLDLSSPSSSMFLIRSFLGKTHLRISTAQTRGV
jgi:hypothetical protein